MTYLSSARTAFHKNERIYYLTEYIDAGAGHLTLLIFRMIFR